MNAAQRHDSGTHLIRTAVQRLVIAGGPKTGKSTEAGKLAGETGMTVRHTDDLIGRYDWSGVSAYVAAEWLTMPGPWVIEGVAAIRALRKWLEMHPTGKPCDAVALFWEAHVPLNHGQMTMAKGCVTVWREIEPKLRARGVVLEVVS